MKILHLMLSCFYVDGFNYQENALPRQNLRDGHDVRIIASTFTYATNGVPQYVKPGLYTNEDGIPVERVAFRRILNKSFEDKIRVYRGIRRRLEEFHPDIILFHGAQSMELLTVAKYAGRNAGVKLYVDNHADLNNSANGWLSRHLLHGIFYRWILWRSLRTIRKIFYISLECGVFLKKVYHLPDALLEFYPLGGDIFEGERHFGLRNRYRRELDLEQGDILLLHSGKMDESKNTIELLMAFRQVENPRLTLLLVGSLSKSIQDRVRRSMEDDARIRYIGWQDPDALNGYLCAADLYIQPGSQTATIQNAICCGCALMLHPHPSYQPYLQGNGFTVSSPSEIVGCLREILLNPSLLAEMGSISYQVAHELLDYRKLASRLYV